MQRALCWTKSLETEVKIITVDASLTLQQKRDITVHIQPANCAGMFCGGKNI